MIWLRLNLWSTSERHLAWATSTGCITSTPSVKGWGATITSITSVFHAFPGCDTTSAFNQQEQAFSLAGLAGIKYVTDTFVYLTGPPFQVLDADDDNLIKLDILIVSLIGPVQDRQALYQAEIWTTSAQTQLVISSPWDVAWTNVS